MERNEALEKPYYMTVKQNKLPVLNFHGSEFRSEVKNDI